MKPGKAPDKTKHGLFGDDFHIFSNAPEDNSSSQEEMCVREGKIDAISEE